MARASKVVNNNDNDNAVDIMNWQYVNKLLKNDNIKLTLDCKIEVDRLALHCEMRKGWRFLMPSVRWYGKWLKFHPLKVAGVKTEGYQKNIISLENGLEIAWNIFFQFSPISFSFYSFLLLKFQDTVLKKGKKREKKKKAK